MFGGPLVDKSKKFAVEIVKTCNYIQKNEREFILTKQLVRSGTSIGANIREANYAASDPDFLNKLQVALKECNETEYWLELLIECGYWEDTSIFDRCVEIKKMLVSATKTSKNKINMKR